MQQTKLSVWQSNCYTINFQCNCICNFHKWALMLSPVGFYWRTASAPGWGTPILVWLSHFPLGCETYSKSHDTISPLPPKNAWLSMWQEDHFLNSWISSNSCNLLLPAEISAGKWDFILNTHLSIPLPCVSPCWHCQKKEENRCPGIHSCRHASILGWNIIFKTCTIHLLHQITCYIYFFHNSVSYIHLLCIIWNWCLWGKIKIFFLHLLSWK